MIKLVEEGLVKLLTDKKQKIATAESCTGGMIAQMITSVAGASAVFDCGIVSYSNEIKNSVLGVKAETLEKYGAVSEQTASEMAQGVKKISGADFAVSVTGIAGPGGGSKEKPVGTVYMGIAYDGGTDVFLCHFSNSPGGNPKLRSLATPNFSISELNIVYR
jgi:PncC family amidohydrolase